MSSPNHIIVLLLLLYLFGNAMGKRTAGLLIFRRSNNSEIEYLMLKPSKDDKVWSPPKGRVDKGEDDFLAALRETEEEIGFTANDLDIHRNHQIIMNLPTKSGKTKEAVYWPAELKSTNKIPKLSHEHSDYRWANKDEASSLYGPETVEMFTLFDNKIKNQ